MAWAEETVKGLEKYQRDGRFHPYTCPNRSLETHPYRAGDRDFGMLVPTTEGWVCRDCDYRQDWYMDGSLEVSI